MIHGLLSELNLTKAFVCISGGILNGLKEELFVHKVRAGAGCKISTVFYKFHSAHVDLFVACDSFFYRCSGLGEGRRIEYYDIERFALFFQAGEKFEYVGTLKAEKNLYA